MDTDSASASPPLTAGPGAGSAAVDGGVDASSSSLNDRRSRSRAGALRGPAAVARRATALFWLRAGARAVRFFLARLASFVRAVRRVAARALGRDLVAACFLRVRFGARFFGFRADPGPRFPRRLDADFAMGESLFQKLDCCVDKLIATSTMATASGQVYVAVDQHGFAVGQEPAVVQVEEDRTTDAMAAVFDPIDAVLTPLDLRREEP